MCNTKTGEEGGEGKRRYAERAAERCFVNWQKIDVLQACLDTYRHGDMRGLTNMRVGPPIELEAIMKGNWKTAIWRTIRECTQQFWIPHQKKRLQQRWMELRRLMVNNCEQYGGIQGERSGLVDTEAVVRGINKVWKGKNIGEGKKSGEWNRNAVEAEWIPPPPTSAPKQLINRTADRRLEELKVLKRGEEVTPLNIRYRVSEEIGFVGDVAVAISWALYGRKNRTSFIYRNIIKYLDSIEKLNIFESRYVELRKGKRRRVHNYKQYRQILYFQQNYLGVEEFRILAILYQVRFRIFHENDRNGRSNVTCKNEVGYNYGRVVDLLQYRGDWAVLKIEENREGEVRVDSSSRKRGCGIEEKIEEKGESKELATSSRKERGEIEVEQKGGKKDSRIVGNIMDGKSPEERIEQNKGERRAEERSIAEKQLVQRKEEERIDGEEGEKHKEGRRGEEIDTQRKNLGRQNRSNYETGSIVTERGCTEDRKLKENTEKRVLEEVEASSNSIGESSSVEYETREESRKKNESKDELGRVETKEGNRTDRRIRGKIDKAGGLDKEEGRERSGKQEVDGEDRQNSRKGTKVEVKKGKHSTLHNREEKIYNDTIAEDSSIELINRRGLGRCEELEERERGKEVVGVRETSARRKDAERGGEGKRERGIEYGETKSKGIEDGDERGRIAGDVDSDASSIDLVDKRMLDSCLKQIEQVNKGREDKRRGKGRKDWEEGEYRVEEQQIEVREELEKEQKERETEKENKEKEILQHMHREGNLEIHRKNKEVEKVNDDSASEVSSIELIDRSKLDRCVEQKRAEEREEVIKTFELMEDAEGKQEEIIGHGGIESKRIGKADKRRRVVGDVDSDTSSIDLVDKRMLDRCMKQIEEEKKGREDRKGGKKIQHWETGEYTLEGQGVEARDELEKKGRGIEKESKEKEIVQLIHREGKGGTYNRIRGNEEEETHSDTTPGVSAVAIIERRKLDRSIEQAEEGKSEVGGKLLGKRVGEVGRKKSDIEKLDPEMGGVTIERKEEKIVDKGSDSSIDLIDLSRLRRGLKQSNREGNIEQANKGESTVGNNQRNSSSEVEGKRRKEAAEKKDSSNSAIVTLGTDERPEREGNRIRSRNMVEGEAYDMEWKRKLERKVEEECNRMGRVDQKEVGNTEERRVVGGEGELEGKGGKRKGRKRLDIQELGTKKGGTAGGEGSRRKEKQVVDMGSDSSIDLVDAEMLRRCLQQSNKEDNIEHRREGEDRMGNSQWSSTGKDRGKGREEAVEDLGNCRSESTTSSIAALFIDERLEREGKKIGRKNITRRKVWMRWKGVIRGEIRRNRRKRRKIEDGEERKEEDRKLVFDYTTQGLSEEEVKLLGRGEAFCVTDYKIDEDRNKVDIYQFQRRLRLHELFRDPGTREEEVDESKRTPSRQLRNRASGGEARNTGRRGHRDSVESIGTGARQLRNRASGGEALHTERRGNRENRGGRGTVAGRGVRHSRVSIRGRPSTMSRRASIGIEERSRSKEREGRRLPSIYDPDSKNRNLNRYNTCIQEEITLSIGDKTVQFRDNISKEERKALKVLKDRIKAKEIIITRADKGSGLVAVDYDRYIEKGTKYIEVEAGAYTRVQEEEHNIISRLIRERNKIAEQLKEEGVITVQTATYIKKQLEEKITGIKFYYKIHKDREIDSMPLRPLQSCIKAPMQHLSIVLTDILQPLLTDRNIPSFIFDSNQLLYRLKKLGRIPSNCTLISSDVSALYPSIPHTEGFNAMKEFLEEYTSYSTQQIGSIIKALELVITANYMTWNKQIYKQVSGVAMGTPVAVAYANIFMHWVDRKVRQKAPYIHEHIRFIDDNLFILPEDRVEQLMQIANNILPPYIKFTYEKLDESTGKGLPFLDTQLFISADRSIESRLYTKATDRHAYLLPSSYHPPHITQNIPQAVLGRIRKICSREEWFLEDAGKVEGWLENRGYAKKEIQKAKTNISQRDRWEMIEKIEQNRDKKGRIEEGETVEIPLIMTYNQHVSKIRKVLKDRQPMLDSAFNKTKVRPRLSFRRKQNLNDIIVQRGLRGPIEDRRKELNVFRNCGERPGYRGRCPCKGKHSQEKCRCCMHSKGDLEGVEPKIYRPVDCNSRNIVYIIGCRECRKMYIGETQQRVKDRLAQHMYNVDKLNQPLYLHFRYVHKLEKLYIGILETVRGVEPFMRKVREAWWINYLKTLEPSGFNVKLECNQVYEATG